MKRDEAVPCDHAAVVANAPRCQRGAVGRRSRDEPQQARERRAGGDHRQRHLRPVLPARRLRIVPRRSEDHGRGWGARQASATVHGRLPRRASPGPRPAVRRDERQGRRADRYVRTIPTNEPEPRTPSAAPAPRRSRAASPRDPDSTVSSSHAPETSASAERTPAEPPSLLKTGALNATAPRGKRAVASIEGRLALEQQRHAQQLERIQFENEELRRASKAKSEKVAALKRQLEAAGVQPASMR